MAQLAAGAERDRDRRRHRRPADRRGDDARAPPRVGDRGRADARHGRDGATDAEKAAAKAKADQALADLKAGKDWETVAKAVSTDATKDQGGDARRSSTRTRRSTPPSSTRMMAVAQNTPTAVIEGADGIYRIGRVTEIVAPVVDATLADQVKDAGIGLDDFRAALRRERRPSKLNDAILAPLPRHRPAARGLGDLPPGRTPSETGKGGRRASATSCTRPTTTRRAASRSPTTDPAWKAAEAEARRDLREAQGRPDAVRRDRPQGQRRGSAVPTAAAPTSPRPTGSLPEFATAIFKPGLVPGQLLAPVKTAPAGT